MSEPAGAGISAESSLQAVLARQGPFPPSKALHLVEKLAGLVGSLHARGRLHRSISAAALGLDKEGRLRLAAPASAVEVGGPTPDPQVSPSELRTEAPIALPAELDAAAAALTAAGCQFDPRRIDVYQLGALLVYLLTGDSVRQYLSSPKSAAKVPPELRGTVDRALGHRAEGRLADCEQLADALRQARSALSPTAAHDTPAQGSVVLPGGDTPPSGHPAALDPGPPRLQEEDLPFARLGHYRVIGRIGHGGMGDVYRGYDDALERPVALKVLPPELARDEDFVRRFAVEAKATARISHPGVVKVHFIGEDGGHHFFAMELIDGEPLAQRLSRQNRLPLDEVCEIARQCLEGLQAAHREGLIHRDVKPGNILIERQTGRAVLVDFGLVRRLGQSQQLTATGMVMGTVDYIAPEQARGRTVDGRADIYSLGVMMYQLLAGRLPFEADTPTAMIFQHAYERPFPLEDAAPDLPAPVIQVVERMMAKAPDDRYPDCATVLADLQAIREGRHLGKPTPVAGKPSKVITAPEEFDKPALPAGFSESVAPGPRRRLGDWLLQRLGRYSPQLAEKLQTTTQQVDGAVAEYGRRHDELAGLLAEAQDVAAQLSAQIDFHREAAAAAGGKAEAARSEADRDAALAQQRSCEQSASSLERQLQQQLDETEKLQPRVAQAAARLAQLRNQRDLLKARLRMAEARGATAPSSAEANRRWILIGAAAIAMAVVLGWGSWRVLSNLAGSRREVHEDPHALPIKPSQPPPYRLFDGNTKFCRDVRFSPDGQYAISAGDDTTIRLWDVATGKEVRRFPGHNRGVRQVAFSPDGNRFVSVALDAKVFLWNVDSTKPIRTFPGPESAATAVAFSPNGQTVLVGHYNDNVCYRNAESGELIHLLEGHSNVVQTVNFDPSGQMAVSGGTDAKVFVWDLTTGKPVGPPFREHRTTVWCTTFSHDGNLVASCDNNGVVLLWDASNRQIAHKWQSAGRPVWCVAFSHDDRFVAATDGKTVGVYDVDSGSLAYRLSIAGGEPCCLDWSLDDRALLVGTWSGAIGLYRL